MPQLDMLRLYLLLVVWLYCYAFGLFGWAWSVRLWDCIAWAISSMLELLVERVGAVGRWLLRVLSA